MRHYLILLTGIIADVRNYPVKSHTIDAIKDLARNAVLPRATRYGCLIASRTLEADHGESLADFKRAYVLGLLDVARDALAFAANDGSALAIEVPGPQ